MTAQGVVLDQGNIFFRHLVETSPKNKEDDVSSDGGDDDDDFSDNDGGDENRDNRTPICTTGIEKVGVASRFQDHNGYHRRDGEDGEGADQFRESVDACTSHGKTGVPNTGHAPADQAEGRVDEAVSNAAVLDIGQGRTSPSQEASRVVAVSSDQLMNNLKKTLCEFKSDLSPAVTETLTLSDDKDDDGREDSDEADDEDDEDRLPGLARAHLSYSDSQDGEVTHRDEERNAATERDPGGLEL
ncbi:hypothetical protein EGW08_011015, partial [Elysia chlorotica]